MSPTSTHLDVTEQIIIDHNNVHDLFERYQKAADKNEKAAIANTLIREMAVHGDAEETSVYNDYANLGLGDTVAHNKEEHKEVKDAVYAADRARTRRADCDQVLEKAVHTFLSHAKEEEEDQLPLVRARLSPQDNDKVARAFLKARTVVPTRPHPSAPQTGGVAQKVAGMPAAAQDKIVETVGGREFVPLKHQHPEAF
ncbi:hypothetical protein V8D89_003070 [Ganoderma adspersum]